MIHNRECFANHMGIYAIEPVWLRWAIAHIKAGHVPARAAVPGRSGAGFELGADGIATIPIMGPIFKGVSKFSEANSVAIRQAVREAASSADVNGIMLVLDSPGGTVAGTSDLADEVAAAAKRKPLHAFIEDLGASAAYWVASQASRISATRTSEIGSIGTLAVVEDTSGKAQIDGVVVHVISTGPFKGAFADGAPVTPEHLAELQVRVNGLNAHFLEAVTRGRKLNESKLSAVSDGRLHLAEEAQNLKLIDAVGTFEDARSALQEAINLRSSKAGRNRRAAALIALAEHGG